jgi:hypothetical protein
LHRAVTQTGAPGTAGRQHAALEIIQLLLAAGADPSLGGLQVWLQRSDDLLAAELGGLP